MERSNLNGWCCPCLFLVKVQWGSELCDARCHDSRVQASFSWPTPRVQHLLQLPSRFLLAEQRGVTVCYACIRPWRKTAKHKEKSEKQSESCLISTLPKLKGPARLCPQRADSASEGLHLGFPESGLQWLSREGHSLFCPHLWGRPVCEGCRGFLRTVCYPGKKWLPKDHEDRWHLCRLPFSSRSLYA